MRDSIFREEFEDFNDFVRKFESLKRNYDEETEGG